MTSTHGVNVEQLGHAVEAITEDPETGRFRFRAETEWTDGLQCVTAIDDFDQAGERIHTREFHVEGDEPEQILGKRTAPNAVELLLAALGSCLSVGYAANAAAMGIELSRLRFELEGEVDLRGFLGISEDVRAGYNTVTCTAYIDADASEEELAELRDRVETTSPLMDNITNAVPLETEVVSERRGGRNVEKPRR
ncbi:OsmC family protein [Halogeometricum pallidum]|nr:OsmC family protein [Halogeometricum pallidum]